MRMRGCRETVASDCEPAETWTRSGLSLANKIAAEVWLERFRKANGTVFLLPVLK